jgi:uncharacterized membrane protein
VGLVDTTEFMSGLAQISPFLPLLVRAIVVGAAVLLTWIILSVVAYWLYQALSQLLNKASQWLATERLSLMAAMHRWLEKRKVPIDSFIEAHSHALAMNTDNAQILDAVAAARTALTSIPSSVSTLDHTLTTARDGVNRAATSIERVNYPETISSPTPDQFALIQVGANQALLKTIVFTIFSVALIGVNTLMLNEFFLSIFPPIRILGVQLSLITACLFSLAEFAMGAGLAFLDVNGKMKSALFALVISAVTALALLEFAFYAAFGQNFGLNPFGASLTEGSTLAILSNSWFGIFGPVVVFATAFCGHMLITGLQGLTKNRVAAQWHTYLKRREQCADHLEQRVVSTTGAIEVLKRACAEIQTAFSDVGRDGAFIERIHAARDQFLTAVDSAKSVQLPEVKPLSRSEMLRLFFSQVFLFLTCIASALFFIFAYGLLGIDASTGSTGLGELSTLVAIVECCILLGAGYVSTRPGNQVQVGLRPVASTAWAKPYLITFIVLLVGTVISANAFFIFKEFTAIEAMWFALLTAVCLWLVRTGQNIGLMMPAAWAFTVACCAVAIAAALWLAAMVTAFGLLCIALINLVAQVLQYPYKLLFARERQSTSPNTVTEQA